MRRLTQLHERTRRRIGLCGFVLLGLLPTVGMFAWGVSRHLPLEEAKMEERLGELFGLKMAVEAVEHPRPGMIRLRGLVFQRPEQVVSTPSTPSILADSTSPQASASTIATLASLDIHEQLLVVDPHEEPRNTICMTGFDLEVARSDLPELKRLFQEGIERRLSGADKNLKISIDRIRLLDELVEAKNNANTPKPLHELSSIEFKLFTLESGPQAHFDFRLINLQNDSTSRPLRFRAGQLPETNQFWFELDTHGQQMPCRLLGLLLPEFNSLGPDALFCGCFWAQQGPKGWEGEFPRPVSDGSAATAQFSHVDLDHLIHRRFAQIFDGRVDITIDKGAFAAGQLKSLRGRVVSTTQGRIGQPLLMAAVKELGLQVNPIHRSDKVVSYQNFATSFELDRKGLRILGHTNEKGEQLIMVDNRHVILWKNASTDPLNVAALLRTLAPDTNSFIPVGPNIQRLAERLPTTK